MSELNTTLKAHIRFLQHSAFRGLTDPGMFLTVVAGHGSIFASWSQHACPALSSALSLFSPPGRAQAARPQQARPPSPGTGTAPAAGLTVVGTPPLPRPTTCRKREEAVWTAEGRGTVAVFRAAALATQHCPGRRGARRVRGARSQSSRQMGSATERPPGGVAAVASCPPGLRSHQDISLGRCGGPFPAASPSTQVFFPSSVARTSSSPVNTAT